MAIRVTVEDTENGDTETVVVEDYLLVTADDCWLSCRVAHTTGTHVLTIKGAIRAPYTETRRFQPPLRPE